MTKRKYVSSLIIAIDGISLPIRTVIKTTVGFVRPNKGQCGNRVSRKERKNEIVGNLIHVIDCVENVRSFHCF